MNPLLPAPPSRLGLLSIATLLALHPPNLHAQDVVDGQMGVSAQASEADYDHALARRARAIRFDGSISIDGVLDEQVWSEAPPITDFVQTLPFEGSAVSEGTEVRLGYDDDAIYVGAVLDDRNPVTTRLARRDAGLGDSDVFIVLLDSYHDHETAYRFWTNPPA